VSRRAAQPAGRFPALLLAALVAFLAGALAVSCGGGGGGGGGPTAPPPPAPGITFTPAASAGPPGISLAAGAASTANVLLLEVRATGVQDLYGIAFDLQFPSGVLTYATSSNAGSILSGGAFEISHTASDLVVGVSRLGAVRGVPGDGLILTLEFAPTAAGSGSFTFSRNTVLDSTGQPIPVSWTAGSVQVVR
jgi:hypothetical protein